MNKIKSRRAKELIENGRFSHDEIQAYVLPENYVETIIIASEQDAEERAVEAFKLVFKGFVADGLADNIAEVDFRRLLKGGQSDV